MPGLVPGIQGGRRQRSLFAHSKPQTHVLLALDCRHKAGNDAEKKAKPQ